MERTMDDGGEPFQCQICLEIAYKPVVQACGHIFCFWCLHRAMDSLDTSHCPLCRSPYQHLPRVCELLHYLLLKALPKEYKERAEEVLEQEREMGTFSPQLGTLDLNGQESKVLELEKEKGTLSSQLGTLDSNGEANEVFKCEKEKGACSPQLVTLDLNGQVSAGTSISERKLRVSDALCAHCKKLIYRPTVLNCGHAFCELCVNYNVFQGTTLKCQVCQSLHPAKSWAVCLELHHFLQNMFAVEYAEREKSMLVQNKQPKEESPTDETAEASCQKETVIHVGVGCDNCGLYPIMGKRYKCKDCSESVGFDLCETCYQSQAGSWIVGRFNQHHKAEHQFEMVAGETLEGGIWVDGDTGQRIYVLMS
ncbi:E3 ubiquitin-protein ligase PRT1 [Cryptomeria japonica]|uniref:E3 ubiquitin-protein ligase PRT1 n=1 Tax=Cryptomeria japonica TaxID=3369 RepID=UPI0027D9FE3B|nr:E3 ubiquitin-protein ligase PRT1 [Cryptomeria japonica]XP_057840275.2 E3 ubiquitin-protein ligase PRT1 [Cryptomeria japonica]XP_057840276.2 E3 ubiquitin-protein ligase PRT1 [Cryptomeria japonica]